MTDISGGSGIPPQRLHQQLLQTEAGQKMAKAGMSKKEKRAAEGDAVTSSAMPTEKATIRPIHIEKQALEIETASGQILRIDLQRLNRNTLREALQQAGPLSPQLYEQLLPLMEQITQEESPEQRSS